MKKIAQTSTFALLATILFSAGSFSQNPNDIVGKWKDEKHNSKQLEIYLGKDGLYYGKEVTSDKIILKQLTYNEKLKNYTGKMSPPEKDITLNVTISFESSTRLKFVAKKFIMSKEIYFVKLK